MCGGEGVLACVFAAPIRHIAHSHKTACKSKRWLALMDFVGGSMLCDSVSQVCLLGSFFSCQQVQPVCVL